MLTVHHLNNSRSQRILWLLEELEIPYGIKKYYRTALQLAPKELLTISPLGKSPVITDDDVVLAESGAIIEYLISKYGNGNFQPTESGYLDNLYYTHYAEGSLMPLIVQKIVCDLVPKKSPFFIRPITHLIFGQLDKQFVQPEVQKHIDLIESHLSTVKTGWFAGEDHPTAADFQMAFPLEGIVFEVKNLDCPRTAEFVRKVHSRPAYKRALEKGGEYAYADF